jgi:hypothetical protein
MENKPTHDEPQHEHRNGETPPKKHTPVACRQPLAQGNRVAGHVRDKHTVQDNIANKVDEAGYPRQGKGDP